MTLTLNFEGQIWNLLYFSQKLSDCHETNSNHIDWILGLKCDHRIWPWPWIFKVKYGILLYLSLKWSDCHETKSKHIDWILGLKCDHRIWPWPWPWPWIFKIKYEICYFSAKKTRIEKQPWRLNSRAQMWPSDLTSAMTLTLNFQGHVWNLLYPQKVVQLPRNEKQTYRLNSRLQMWPMSLTLTMTLTFECWRSNVTLIFWRHTCPWPWILMVKFWNSCISEWEGRLTLHKECR